MAAEAIGTTLGSIVKSLIFVADGKVVLALVAGDKRASTEKLTDALGADGVRIANADEVREQTGYAIGGVPPVAHTEPLTTVIDQSLSRFETVYAAAGSPRAIFPIRYTELLALTQGKSPTSPKTESAAHHQTAKRRARLLPILARLSFSGHLATRTARG